MPAQNKGKRRTSEAKVNFGAYTSPAKLQKNAMRGPGSAPPPIEVKIAVYGEHLAIARFVDADGYHPLKQTALAVFKGLGMTGMRVTDPNENGVKFEFIFWGFFEAPERTFAQGTADRLIIDDDVYADFAEISKRYNGGDVITLKTEKPVDFGPRDVVAMTKNIRLTKLQLEIDDRGRALADELGQKPCARLLEHLQDYLVCVNIGTVAKLKNHTTE